MYYFNMEDFETRLIFLSKVVNVENKYPSKERIEIKDYEN